MANTTSLALLLAAVSVPVSAGMPTRVHAQWAPFRMVSTGPSHSCGVRLNGVPVCWGRNSAGQLGDGSTKSSNRPVEVADRAMGFIDVAAGGAHSCGIALDSTAYCWGQNLEGQLGTGTLGMSLTPARVAGVDRYRAIAAGNAHTCALSLAGRAACWGSGRHGQLGVDSVEQSPVPVVADGHMTFESVTAGGDHVCAVTADGAAYCWGRNAFGQLGDGTHSDRARPTRTRGEVGFVTVSAGHDHTCAIAADGRAYCWGRNGVGQLGDGGTTSAASPQPVAGAHRFVSISAGGSHTCAVTPDGTIYCWGSNTGGQLGLDSVSGTRLPKHVPTDIAMAVVRAGGRHSCGIEPRGTVHCWGATAFGAVLEPLTADILSDADPRLEVRPQVINCPPPQYPRNLQDQGVQGRVLLEFLIGTDGQVDPTSVRVVERTHDGFAPAAVTAIRGCRFQPGRVAGAAVRVLVRMPVVFAVIRDELD